MGSSVRPGPAIGGDDPVQSYLARYGKAAAPAPARPPVYAPDIASALRTPLRAYVNDEPVPDPVASYLATYHPRSGTSASTSAPDPVQSYLAAYRPTVGNPAPSLSSTTAATPPMRLRPVVVTARSPLAPPAAAQDATVTPATAPFNPQAHEITTPVVGPILKYAVDPVLEHPLQAVAMANPVGAVIGTAMMGKDIAQYAGQKAAELSLPADERRLAEADPDRIPGARAAVEAGMLALPVLAHGAIRGAGRLGDVSEGMMEAGARGLADMKPTTSVPSGVPLTPETPSDPLARWEPVLQFIARHEDHLRGTELRALYHALPEGAQERVRTMIQALPEHEQGTAPITPDDIKAIQPLVDFQQIRSFVDRQARNNPGDLGTTDLAGLERAASAAGVPPAGPRLRLVRGDEGAAPEAPTAPAAADAAEGSDQPAFDGPDLRDVQADANRAKIAYDEQSAYVRSLPHDAPELDEARTELARRRRALKNARERVHDTAEARGQRLTDEAVDRFRASTGSIVLPAEGEAAPAGGSSFLTTNEEPTPAASASRLRRATAAIETVEGAKQTLDQAREHAARDELRRRAETDALTGVGNRDALDRALPAAEADPNTAVVAFDVNNGGRVNKVEGQKAGDAMIQGVSTALSRAAETVGVPARIFRRGGDEFVALVPKDQAEAFRQAAETHFGARTVVHEGEPYTISLTGTHGDTFEEADAQLQGAKKARKTTESATAVTTPYDTPATVEARRYSAEQPPTARINTPVREALRTRLEQEAYGEGAPAAGRGGKEATFLIGPAGAGKSTLVDQLGLRDTHLVTDADKIAESLPEYANGKGKVAVHREAANIRDRVVGRAVANGDNVVIQTQGNHPEDLQRQVDALHAAGWKVHVVFADLPKDVAAQRAVDRYAAGGHFVDPGHILRTGDLPAQTYDALKDHPGVTSYARYDTNVERGQPARLVEAGHPEGQPQGEAGEAAPAAVRGAGSPGRGEPDQGHPAGAGAGHAEGTGEPEVTPRAAGRVVGSIGPRAEPNAEPPATGTEGPQGIEYRHLGIGIPADVAKAAHTAVSEAVTDPNAAITEDHPELARAIASANAMTPTQAATFARQLAERAVAHLTPEQRTTFGKRLLLDQLTAEAERKGAAADQIEADAKALRERQQQAAALATQAKEQARESTTQERRLRARANTQAGAAKTGTRLAERIAAERDRILAQPNATHEDLVNAAHAARNEMRTSKGAARQAERALEQAGRVAAKHHETFVSATNEAEALAAQRQAMGETPEGADARRAATLERRAGEASDRADAAFANWNDAEHEAEERAEALRAAGEAHAQAATRHAALRDVLARSAKEGDLRAKARAADALKDAQRADAQVAASARRYAAAAADRMARAAKGMKVQADQRMNEWTEAKRTAQTLATRRDELAQALPPGVERTPWFQKALQQHLTTVQPFLDEAAKRAGVDPAAFRQPALGAYMRLIPPERLSEPLIRRAQSIAAGEGDGMTTPRTGLARRLLGQKRGVLMASPHGTEEPMQGPVDLRREKPGGGAVSVTGTKVSGSTNRVRGAAAYSHDYLTNIAYDAADKVSKAAHNAIFQAIAKDAEAGRGGVEELKPDRDAPPGKRVIAFNDSQELVDPPPPDDEMSAKVRRFAVPKDVATALDRYRSRYTYPGKAGRAVRAVMGTITKSVLMNPVVAASHTLTLSSSVGTGIPAEAGAARAAATGLPFAKTASTIARMKGIDFTDPATVARLGRLAFNGALRLSDDRGGGVLDAGHHFLFGPKGMDVRARLVASEDVEAALRKAGITPDDPRFAGLERKYVVEHAGNYVARNQGTAAQWLQDNGIAPFIAINRAKLGTSLKALVGSDGTIKPSAARRLGVAARGPLGASASIAAASYLLSGHKPSENAPGHEGDMALGVYHTPDGRYVYFRGAPKDAIAQFGKGTREVYLRRGIIDPASEAALRVLQPMLVAHQGDRLHDVLKASVNTALGFIGPGPAAAFGLATGQSLYLNNEDNFATSEPPMLPGEKDLTIKNRLLAAARNANAGASLILPPQGAQPKNVLGRPFLNAFAEGNPLAREGQERYDVQQWMDGVVSRIYRESDRAKRQQIMADALDEAKQHGYQGPYLRRTFQRAVNRAGVDHSGAAQRRFENRIRGPQATGAGLDQ